MSENKHTPGPWSIDDHCDCCVVGPDQDRMRITMVHTSHPLAEDRANARLIAAAPDMLALLQRCNERIGGAVIHKQDTRDFDLARDIDALIKKASP